MTIIGSQAELHPTVVDRASPGIIPLFEEVIKRPGTAKERLWCCVTHILQGITEQPAIFMVILRAFVSDAVPSKARDQNPRLARRTQDLIAAAICQDQQASEVIGGGPEQLAVLLRWCIQRMPISHTLTGRGSSNTETLIGHQTGTSGASITRPIF